MNVGGGSTRIFRRSTYCCIPRLPLQSIQQAPSSRSWPTFMWAGWPEEVEYTSQGQAKLLPVYLELRDAATFRGSYNERISTTFNNGSGLAHCFTQNSNRNQNQFFFPKNKMKKRCGVCNLISYKWNMNANNTNETAKEIFGKCV
jgi:hypothetical protein